MTQLFNPGLLGLASLSDIASVAAIDALAGAPAEDNLLILSLDSRRLVETTRTGTILSSFDLAGVTTQAIEGVTIDENGIIYLVAEGADDVRSRLIALAPIPEPETYALMLLGLAAVVWRVRQRSRVPHSA
jgi:hypothetical protein